MHRHHKKLLTILLAALPAACTVGPNYSAPNLKTDPTFTPNETATTIEWHPSLDDPQLAKLLDQAVHNNLDLQLATARILQAREEAAVVGAEQWPTVNANAGYSWQRYSQNAAPFNAFNIPGFPWEFNLYQAGFDANWELDIFGGTRRAIQAAGANLQASVEDRRAVLVSLQGEVARNYIDLRRAQALRTLGTANLQSQNETLDLTRSRAKNGAGSDLDVARAAAQSSATEATLPVYDRIEWQSLHRLAVLTNQPLDDLLYLRQSAAIPTVPNAVGTGIPADLLRRRPDIRRAERHLAEASARVGIAEAELYPKFSITGFFNFESASIEDLFDWKSRAFSLGPTVRWPIFQAGQLEAVVRVRNAQQQEALITYEQSVQNAIQEVRDELVNFSTEHRRRDSLAQAVKNQQDAVDLARQLYSQGLADFLTVLDAQRQLYLQQDELAQSDARLAASYVALYKALGGGWETESAPGSAGGSPAATPDEPTLVNHSTPATAPAPEAKP